MFRVNKSRKRSVVWRFYKPVDSQSVQCLLCEGYQVRQCHGSTTAMLRHLRVKHPKEVAKKYKGLISEPTNGDLHMETDDKHTTNMETDDKHFCSVEVALEEGDSNNSTTVNESDIHSSMNGTTEAAPVAPAGPMTHEEESADRPVKHTGNKRSLIWKYFDHLEKFSAARCHTCMKKFQFSESSSTSNLRRHLSTRHPELFAKIVAERCRPRQSNSALSSKPNNSPAQEIVAVTPDKLFSVTVTLEDGDSEVPTAVNESDILSINGNEEAVQGDAAEQVTQEVASDGLPLTLSGQKWSLIWKYFDHLKSLDAARCHICMKKVHCPNSRATSNLCRHMSKRHPELFHKLSNETCKSQTSSSNGDVGTAPGNVATTGQKVFFDSRVCDREKYALSRERELLEALRKAQREEARALEHQRELLEKLRAADAKETAAAIEKVESLQKTQQQEAEELCRQRAEVQREREELQKEREELQREREELRQERETLAFFPLRQ